jgi:lipopolysaccharide transport system permease protein
LIHALSERAERISPAAYFELLMNLTKREVMGRYSQSVFGVGWAIAQPVAAMAVFTVVFSRLGKLPSDGAPYPLFAYAGLMLWFFFSNSVSSGTSSLVTYRDIVTKTYFPREIVPLAQVCSRLIDFAAAAVLFGGLMAYYRVSLNAWSLLAPIFFALLMVFTIGVTLFTSALNVFYRDVNPVVQITLQFWVYVTPVAYPMSARQSCSAGRLTGS